MINRWLSHLPLRRKMMLLVVISCMGALSFTATAFLISDYLRYKDELIREWTGRADMVALNSAAALAFGDHRTASENLLVLGAYRDFAMVSLYNSDAKLFAAYQTSAPQNVPTSAPEVLLSVNQMHAFIVDGKYFELVREVRVSGDVIGYLLLRASLNDLQLRWQSSLKILLITVALAQALAVLLSGRLQKMIGDPIVRLAATMNRVTREQNYALREVKHSEDETGHLVEGFNAMLTQIESRDQELLSYRDHLERLVDARTSELAKARDEAEKANRAKSIFLANMSHEIRTPMNAVLGYTQILQHDTSLNMKQLQSVQAIEKAGMHLLDIINDILDLSKIEAGALELRTSTFDMHEMIAILEQIFRMRCEQKKLEWRLLSNVTPGTVVVTDQAKLRQILINLLGNASKFTDEGFVSLSVQQEDQQFTFTVADSGGGISKLQQQSIFEPFHQGDSGYKKGGTGLGLALVKRHLELMGSEIVLESLPGEGALFRFTLTMQVLPKRQESLEPPEFVQEQQNEHEQKVLRVMIVDDVAGNREVLMQLLQQTGCVTLACEDGESALSEVSAFQPDIVFMDIRMPGMDGFTAMQKIRQLTDLSAVNIIAITASSFERSPEEYLRAGFDGFIAKPFIFSQLCQIVHDLTGVRLKVKSAYPDPVVGSDSEPEQIIMPHAQLIELRNAVAQSDLSALRKLQEPLRAFPRFWLRWDSCLATYDVDGLSALLTEVGSDDMTGEV